MRCWSASEVSASETGRRTRRSVELEAVDVNVVAIQPGAEEEKDVNPSCRRSVTAEATYMSMGRRRVPGSKSLALAFCVAVRLSTVHLGEKGKRTYLDPPSLPLAVNSSRSRRRVDVSAVGILENDARRLVLEGEEDLARLCSVAELS